MTHSDEFINYLKSFVPSDDGERASGNRAALATLRRALTGKPSDVVRTFQYIGDWLPPGQKAQDFYILVAGLFASHSQSTDHGNLGMHLAALRDVALRENDAARAMMLDKRLAAMLQVRSSHLGPHLRRMISFLKQGGIPVNWSQLLRDLRHWDDPQGYVQYRWALAFWGERRSDRSQSSNTGIQE